MNPVVFVGTVAALVIVPVVAAAVVTPIVAFVMVFAIVGAAVIVSAIIVAISIAGSIGMLITAPVIRVLRHPVTTMCMVTVHISGVAIVRGVNHCGTQQHRGSNLSIVGTRLAWQCHCADQQHDHRRQ